MAEISPLLRIIIGLVSIVILTLTAAIKFEHYLTQRHERLIREDARQMQSFLNFLKARNADIDDIDQTDVENLDNIHKQFLENHNIN